MRLFALFAVVLTSLAAQIAGDGPGRFAGGVTAPSVVSKVQPEYSKEAAQSRVEGTVHLLIAIDEKGTPRDLRVIVPLGYGLDEKAIEAVQQWKFRPGMKDGKPVAVHARIELKFRIDHGWRLADISYRSPDGVSSPRVHQQKYPEATGGAASVTLSFDVDEHGSATHIGVEKSSDQSQEAGLVAALQEWVFSPGRKNGLAVVVPCTARFVLGEVGK